MVGRRESSDHGAELFTEREAVHTLSYTFHHQNQGELPLVRPQQAAQSPALLDRQPTQIIWLTVQGKLRRKNCQPLFISTAC